MWTRQSCACAVAMACILMPAAAGATIIIDNTTLGFYNSGLGDLSTDSVLGTQTDMATGFNLFPAANSSAGDPTVPPVATEPNLAGADPGTQAALGSFLGNTTALGGSWSAAPQAIPANWAINDETAIVYEITVGPTGFDDLLVQIGVDNGIYAWFDGSYVFGAMDRGGAFAFEYSFQTGPVSPGAHYLQLLREDHGGATGWVISADATEGAPVPEPSTLSLMVLATLGLVARRRRR
jgi:hypothetical protein